MSRISDYVRREPVRVYGHGVGLAAIALLVFYGVLTAASAPLWIGLLTALVAVPSLTEKVRGAVKPTATLPATDPDSTAHE